jgi:hypothetical protein
MVGAASLHVQVGSSVNVVVRFCSARIGTAMGAISVGPAIFEGLPTAATSSSTSVASIPVTSTAAAASCSVSTSGSSARVVVAVDLGLEI